MAQVPSIPPVIDSNPSDYQDSGVTSTVAIAGHPFHPLLVTFPIAFLVGAAGTDLSYWLTEDPFWSRASLWLIGSGFISGSIAAASGLMDFVRIDRVRKRSAGWFHLFGNIAVLLLTLVNWVFRFNDPAAAVLPVGIVLSLVVATILGVTGWYGAELAYRHKVGVIGTSSRYER